MAISFSTIRPRPDLSGNDSSICIVDGKRAASPRLTSVRNSAGPATLSSRVSGRNHSADSGVLNGNLEEKGEEGRDDIPPFFPPLFRDHRTAAISLPCRD